MDILSDETCPHQSIVEKELERGINRDDYPILWYEPDIDLEGKRVFKTLLQENSTISLFSRFEDIFKVAQSLGSFLLITPTEVDEEKLFQDFRALEGTYARRYFDFEEEAVLLGLFKENPKDLIKSLKVYVFCTHEDFLREVPINEEEEVIVKCDIKEMTEQFREDFTIIWCDPNFAPTERFQTLFKQLDIEEKNIYISFEELLEKLDNYNELPYHLVLSGRTQTELIINRIDSLKSLLKLYIFDGLPLTVNGEKASKIEVGKTIEELIPKVIRGVRIKSKYKNTFPAFATQFDDWDKSHINRVHYYLRGFINFKNRRQAKQDFINLAKRVHESQKLLEFEKEYFEYDKEQILKWYAAESPIYKIINNCLRISTSDSILYGRFLLKDMERAIKEEYRQESARFHGVVYRGAYMTSDEFAKLGRNVGKEIEMYGFLSTSRNLQTAKKFLNDDTVNKVLITILIPSLPLPEFDEQGFVDLSKFSKFSTEEEILFNVRSRFQVLKTGSIQLSTSNKEYRHVVLLYGAQLLRQYMTKENPRISMRFELPLEFQCISCYSKKNLFASTDETEKTQLICRGCFNSENFISRSTFLLPIDENVQLSGERRINVEVPGKILTFGIEAKLNYEQAYQCHQCLNISKDLLKSINLEDGNILLSCSKCLKESQERRKVNYLLLLEGNTQVFWNCKQRKWEEVEVNWKIREFKDVEIHHGAHIFKKAHDTDKCLEFWRIFLQNSVRKMGRERLKVMGYWNLGKTFAKLGEYQNTLKCFLKTIEILKSTSGEFHQDIASSYNGLASLYDSLGEYQKATEFHLKALDIRKSVYGELHLKTAASYNHLALVYDSLGDYKGAAEYYLTALQIRKTIYGESHPKTVALHNNLALVYKSLGDFKKALEYLLEVHETLKSIYGEAHPDTAASYNNLASVFKSLREYQKALEYHRKALQIRKNIYGEEHPEIAASYNNIASVYYNLGEYRRALEYHLKALQTQQFIFGEVHPETATSYNNAAVVYDSLGDYQKAFEFHLKALELRKTIYGESHPQIATSYQNLASVYQSLGEYNSALEYLLKAQEIQKSIFGESHAQTAISYNGLALVYHSLGEHQKALEYNEKALATQKCIYGEGHPETASSYHNLASVHFSLGEHQKALVYNLKTLEIRKSIYREAHPDTATSYNNLAAVYKSLGEYQNALKYHRKALKIRKSIFGKIHPDTAASYNNLASVYLIWEKSQKALEYFLKALEILKSVYGEAHPQTSALYKNLAVVYDSLGEHQKAFEYHQKVLGIEKLSTEICLIENSVNNVKASEILGKRSLSKKDDEEKLEPNAEKKLKH